MAKLSFAGAALAFLCPCTAQAETAQWAAHIAEASRRFSMPGSWIERVIEVESGGRVMIGGRPTTSPAGAMGLMQLMPATWEEMRRRYGLGSNPHDPRDNIFAGTAYLRAMVDRFGVPGGFAAYNAGPERYRAYLQGTRSLPPETRNYVRRLAVRRSLPGHFMPISESTASERQHESTTLPAASAAAGMFAIFKAGATQPQGAPAATGDMIAIRH